MMESNLVSEFINETHCDIETAYTYLQGNCWDIGAALESWRYPNIAHEDDTTEEPELCSDSNDGTVISFKKLSRGISRATDNVNLVSRARCEFAQNFKQNPCFKLDRYFIDTPEFTFTLPDLSIYGEEFRKFLDKDLIENSTLVSLEQSGRLNWWAESGVCQRLWPLATTGDGNCLLHAASLAMWGFHDRLLTLRKALHSFLEASEYRAPLYRRWRWQQTKVNQQSGFVYSESEWIKEWENIVNMASTEPRKNTDNTTYESLEEIHVLTLAHVLRRPIIVVADVMLKDINNEPFAPIPFGGIYLPLECSPKECHRSPLLLTYDMAHFSALVAMEKEQQHQQQHQQQPPLYAVIPLTDADGVILPLQFSVDPGPTYVWSETHEQTFINSLILSEKEQISLLREYLDVVDISPETASASSPDLDSEEEIEKRFSEIIDLSADGAGTDSTLFGNKNRAAKQLQSVAKQFGSIGKSMSKKLKKNFGSITKITTNKPKKNDSLRHRLLCAEIHTKRHEYQEEMIKNYLLFAQKRFLREQKQKQLLESGSPEGLKLQEQALLEGPLKCINANCDAFGTVLTSYMCDKCYEMQRNEELSKISVDSRAGTGRSKFYRDPDLDSYDAVRNLPIAKSNLKKDRTLYLSKSTFYNDSGLPFEPATATANVTANTTLNTTLNTTINDPTQNEQSKHPLPVFLPDEWSNRSISTSTDIDNSNVPFVSKHVSNFDFGNVDNVNHIMNDKETRKEPLAEEREIEVPDSLQFFRNKKKYRDQMTKEQQSTSYISYQNGNENRHPYNANRIRSGLPNFISNFDSISEYDKGMGVAALGAGAPTADIGTGHVSYNLSRQYPECELRPLTSTPESSLQPCKTNHCNFYGSKDTNYYCSKCTKERQLSGITI